MGGLVVQQGDPLHGGAKGVTSIPLELTAEAAEIADELMQAEETLIGYVRGSRPKTLASLTESR